MKYRTPLVVGALLISLFAGCSTRPAHSAWTSSDSIVIEPGVSVGPVHSGMAMQQVVAELGEPDQKKDGVLVYRNLGLAVGPGKGGIVQTVVCGSGGNAFLTKSFTGHTKEGIGIGASRAEVVSAYGKPTATESWRGKSEFEIMKYDSLGVQFSLRDDKVRLIAVFFKP
jgi:hypothetical protein